MRPIRLTLEAFGPYKDREVIDFTALKDHSLFVISGKTGAGKTTIFDGICFALYGSASGQDRDHQSMLRSHFAEDDVHTLVELIFQVHGRTFRIFRQLPHIKEGNKTPTGERYGFFEIIDGEEVPFVDRQIVTEINQKVEDLLGLTEDQFKQIVMLPQGEFLKLLTSETENKEAILRRLFKTEHYQKMGERLWERKQVLEEQLKEKWQTQDHFIEHLKESLPFREESTLFSVLYAEHYNIHQVQEGLDEEKNYYEAKEKEDKKVAEQASEAHDQAQKKLHEAKVLNEQFKKWEELKKQLQLLQEQKPRIEALQKRINRAKQAQHLFPYEQQVDTYIDEVQKKEKAFQEKERLKIKIEEKWQQAKENYAEEEKRDDEREYLRSTLERLERYLPIVNRMNTQRKTLSKLEQRLTSLKANQKEIETKLQKERETFGKMGKQITELEQEIHPLPTFQEQWQKLQQKQEKIQTYFKGKEQYYVFYKNLKEEEKSLAQAQLAYDALEEKWFHHQAHALAYYLEEGEACPVCGSYEHPNKATLSEEDQVREAQLLEARRKIEHHSKRYYHYEARCQSMEEELKAYSFDVFGQELVDLKHTLKEEIEKLQQTIEQLYNKRKKLPDLKEAYEKQGEKVKKIEAKKEQCEEDLMNKRLAYREQTAVFQRDCQEVPEELQHLKILEQQMEEIKTKKKKREKAWEAAQKLLQTTEKEKAQIETEVKHLKNELDDLKRRKQEAKNRFKDVLKAAKFNSVEDYKRAKLTEEKIKEFERSIDQFEQDLHITTEREKELQQQLKDQQPKDVTRLKERVTELKEKSEQAIKTLQTTGYYKNEIIKTKDRLKKIQGQIEKDEEQLHTVTNLANVIRGNNRLRLSFERFLQIEYLEQIIEAANERLYDLSNGQYLLIRSDRQEAYGRQSGLAFDIFDAYTGQTRDVKTLSGGEKFNASLSLALGMSDVIQSFKGQISIETMFIDEGFGSLDEEALNKAIDTLVHLQNSGRMIGVISHVQELKRVFPAVLEVSKTKEGYSQTNFTVTRIHNKEISLL